MNHLASICVINNLLKTSPIDLLFDYMNRIQSRNSKVNKNFQNLKKQQIKINPSYNKNQILKFNDSMILKFPPSTKGTQEENCFLNRNIFAQRSQKRVISSTNHPNKRIQQRRDAFFIPICSVRDMQSPLKTDIIKDAYNTPLNKIKSQRSQFPLSYQNIKFNLPRSQKCSDKNQKLIKNHLLQLLRRKSSSKKQLISQQNRSKTSFSRNCVTEQRQHHRRAPSINVRKALILDITAQKRSLQDVRIFDSFLSVSKNDVEHQRIKPTFVLSPWQFDN